MNDTIAVFASARRNGNTGRFIDWIAKELSVEVIDLTQKDLTPFDYEHKNIDDDFIPLIKQLLSYRNIIIASPVYWYCVSAQMKVFIDRTSDLLDIEALKDIGRQLRGKVGYVVCTSISEDADSSFINSLKDTFEYLGMTFGGYVHADCDDGYNPDLYENDVKNFVHLIQNESTSGASDIKYFVQILKVVKR